LCSEQPERLVPVPMRLEQGGMRVRKPVESNSADRIGRVGLMGSNESTMVRVVLCAQACLPIFILTFEAVCPGPLVPPEVLKLCR
jgi:hypothetical protein